MKYIKITSASNPLIRAALKGKKDLQPGCLFIEGQNLIETAVASGAEMGTVFFTGDYKAGHASLLRRLAERASCLIETTEKALSRLCDTETPQGIAATASIKTYSLNEVPFKKNPLMAVCDGIQDPGNLGAIIRTSDAAGADAVIILPESCNAFMPKVVRSTAGSIFNIPIVFSDAEMLSDWAAERKITLAATAADAPRTIFDADLRMPLVLVFGSEADGVGEKIKKSAQLSISIPIFGRAESLNVAASAAICLYEAVRQRMGKSAFK